MWLIQPDTLHQLETRRLSYTGDPVAREQYGEDKPYKRMVAKDYGSKTATISIDGVMTKRPDLIAMLFMGGNATYADIIEAVEDADADPDIDTIALAIDSPGGNVNGLLEAVAAVEACQTNTVAKVSGNAASAGYILASVCDEIVATNESASFGSFGVVIDAYVDEDRVSITNSASPDKRPDLSTEEGRGVVRDHLDSIHAVFEQAVAAGRGVPESQVTERFGAGRMFVAAEAKDRGMIDRIEQRGTRRAAYDEPPHNGGSKPPESKMDLDTLKAQHPDVFRAAADIGVAEERDRVSAHLTMGQSSGDMQTAIEAIESGSAMTASVQAKYLAASMRKGAMEERQTESDEAEEGAQAGADGGQPEASGVDAHREAVADILTSKEVI